MKPLKCSAVLAGRFQRLTLFTALRAKYDAEINSLKSMMESMEKQQVVIAKQKELMEDIKNAVDELIGGIE